MTAPTEARGPGIYFDVPDAEYRAWPYVSQSLLSMFRDPDNCELDILDAMNEPSETSDAMQLGLDIEAVLDGKAIGGNIQVLPSEIKVRRGKAWEAWRDEHPGIDWVPMSEYKAHGLHIANVDRIVASIKDHDLAVKLIDGAKRQVSFVWDATFSGMTGEEVTHRVKGRLDYIKPGLIADLKTSSMGGQRRVGQWAWTHAWDIQAALYTDAMNALTGEEHDFYFIVARTTRRAVVTVYNGHNTTEAAGAFLDIGRRAYQIYLERLAECKRMGEWRGYYSEDNAESRVLDFQLPGYAG